MATLARSAPLPEKSPLVADPQFQELLPMSRSLIQKILLAIPDAHKSCIYTQTLKLNSSEDSKLEIVASNIGIPSAPKLKVVSENVETSLRQMSEGLQLHWALLKAVLPRLEDTNKVKGLIPDIKDLTILINKMLKISIPETMVQPSPTPIVLQLPGEYEIQVAAHLTLVRLQSFLQDMVRCFRSLDLSNDEELDS